MDVSEVKPIQLTPEATSLRQQMKAGLPSGCGYSGEAAHADDLWPPAELRRVSE